MSDAAWIALFTALPPTLAALATLISTLRANKKIAEIHTATNGMKAELEAVARKEGKAEGKLEERAEEKDRRA